jgi:L-2-hydroxyglutarate oxidase LhgO
MSTDFDAIVVGAGSVGLACGYALARQGHSVAVLERERRVGAGISSRNSEVIHAGLHYPPGSLKARFCVEGRRPDVRLPRPPQRRLQQVRQAHRGHAGQ